MRYVSLGTLNSPSGEFVIVLMRLLKGFDEFLLLTYDFLGDDLRESNLSFGGVGLTAKVLLRFLSSVSLISNTIWSYLVSSS